MKKKKLIDHIDSNDSKTLNEEKNEEEKNKKIKQISINQKRIANGISAAGKNLKTVSIFIIISIISSFFLSIIIYNQEDTKNIHTFLFFGLFINFIFSVVIIYNLYLAGENLENYIKD